jgi:hypothetical protein
VKKKTGYSLVSDFEALSKQLAQSTTKPTINPSELPLSEIKLWPKVFQHRGAVGHASKAHVIKLTAAVRKSKGNTLDPIAVWWDGKEWACIDGHHRFEAYKAAGLNGQHLIPVEVFSGSLGQAMAKAAQANTGDKLGMTSAEKSDAAWHMVTMTQLSKEETATAARVSESTVANMRKVFNQLKEQADNAVGALSVVPWGDCRDLSWNEARRSAKGGDAADFDRETANEKKAQEMALGLRKALGAEAGKYPEIFAMALEIYDKRLPDALAEWWSVPKEVEDTGF